MTKSNANAILTLLQGCNSLTMLKKIHAQVFVNGLHHHLYISLRLLHFCSVSSSGCLLYAQLLFRHLHFPPTPAWNSLIRGFSLSPSPRHSLYFYNRMLPLSRPDTFTFAFALKACERIRAPNKCMELHCSLLRSGYGNEIVVCTSLVRCYAANGQFADAQMVFDELSQRDLVCWNAIISCYSQAGLYSEALRMYGLMRIEGVEPDGFTLVGLLSSCAHVGALAMGAKLHEIARVRGLAGNVFVGNALIDMYAKCGSLEDALGVFNGMSKRDVLTWNSMIGGFLVHGCGLEAISLFRQMLIDGVQPNSVTFLGLLSGCSHQGLVLEGEEHFNLMTTRFSLKPGIKHYGCMVDLYGRAGKLEQALEFIHTSSSQNDPVLWRTLLGACKIHRDVEMAEVAMRMLVHLGASNAGDCVLLASIFAAAKDAAGVARMRKQIKRQGIKTTPGWSCVELGGQVHRFVADDKSHPETSMIYQKLEELVIHGAVLTGHLGRECIMNMSSSSLEGCSETSSRYHSAQLCCCVCFGLGF